MRAIGGNMRTAREFGTLVVARPFVSAMWAARYLHPEAFPGGAPADLTLFSNTKVVFRWELSRGETVVKSAEVTLTVNNATQRGIPLPNGFGGRVATASARTLHRVATEAADSAKGLAEAVGATVSCQCLVCSRGGGVVQPSAAPGAG